MARIKIKWSIEAKNDLFEILEYFNIRNKSTSYSKKLFKKINSDIQLLARNPDLGISTDHKNVRYLISGNYEVIYEKFDGLILVIMIWPSMKDPSKKISKHAKKINRANNPFPQLSWDCKS